MFELRKHLRIVRAYFLSLPRIHLQVKQQGWVVPLRTGRLLNAVLRSEMSLEHALADRKELLPTIEVDGIAKTWCTVGQKSRHVDPVDSPVRRQRDPSEREVKSGQCIDV